jgi:hypothetical protein
VLCALPAVPETKDRATGILLLVQRSLAAPEKKRSKYGVTLRSAWGSIYLRYFIYNDRIFKVSDPSNSCVFRRTLLDMTLHALPGTLLARGINRCPSSRPRICRSGIGAGPLTVTECAMVRASQPFPCSNSLITSL